jgi:hypothetical protein
VNGGANPVVGPTEAVALAVFVIVLGLALTFLAWSVRLVRQGRCLAVFRLGRFLRLAGPGIAILVPLIDRTGRVAVGDVGVMWEAGRAEFRGRFIPVVAAFAALEAGMRVVVDRIEGEGPNVRVLVGPAG